MSGIAYEIVYIADLQPEDWTDEDQFEAAETRADIYHAAQRFDRIKTICDWAEKDACYIAQRGVSSISTTSSRLNEIKRGNQTPGSPWFRVGEKYYDVYCYLLTRKVHEKNTSRPPLRIIAWED